MISSCPPRKRVLARAVATTPWTRAALVAERRRPGLRIVNYHGTPFRARAALEQQIDHLLVRYRPLDPFRLESVVVTGCGEPSILFTFDDGLAVHRTVAAEVLESHGVRGVFCVPSGYADVPEAEQREWFRARVYPAPTELHVEEDDTVALSRCDVRDLVERGHRICSHSRTHERMCADTPPQVLHDEIEGSREELESALGAPVNGFCWPVMFDPAAGEADRLVRATYEWALTGRSGVIRAGHDPYRLGRTNLEASWPLDVVDLQLSGILDLRARR